MFKRESLENDKIKEKIRDIEYDRSLILNSSS